MTKKCRSCWMRCSPLRSSRAREQVLSSPIAAPRKITHFIITHASILLFFRFFIYTVVLVLIISKCLLLRHRHFPPLGSLKIAGRINAFEIWPFLLVGNAREKRSRKKEQTRASYLNAFALSLITFAHTKGSFPLGCVKLADIVPFTWSLVHSVKSLKCRWSDKQYRIKCYIY